MIQILYGVNGNTIDITNICLSELSSNNIITIPDNDNTRCMHFSDPIVGTQKYIYVILDSVIYKYNCNYLIKINTLNNTITSRVSLKILYGVTNNTVDVTEICFSQLKNDNIIIIPNNDTVRSTYFNDHLYGVEKKVFIVADGITREYNTNVCIKINTDDSSVFTENISTIPRNNETVNSTISILHSQLKLKHGSLHDELSEQKMVVQYLTGNETVLELGGNIGRNSLIIASILDNSAKLVTLECDSNVAKLLSENRDLNNLNFNIENSALSNGKLMQRNFDKSNDDSLVKVNAENETVSGNSSNDDSLVKVNADNETVSGNSSNDDSLVKVNAENETVSGNSSNDDSLVKVQTDYETVSGDTLIDGYKWVNTITLSELKSKYNIDFFDTLVLDCEGAFYYILMDMPEILENINLIIMENDYNEISHKEYIDKILKKNEFYVDYVEEGGWKHTVCPCQNNFFEVWKKHKFLPEK
jgi:FkbM family methyltransferase